MSEKGSVDVTTPGIRRYYIVENEVLLKSPLSLTAKLLKISKIWDKISNYSIIEMLLKFNENIKLYLISYLYRYEIDEINENLIIDYAEYLIKIFAILDLVDIGYSSSKFKTYLFGLNIKLVDKCIDINEIKDSIQAHIEKEWDRKDIKLQILEYNKNLLVFLNEYIYCKSKKVKFSLPAKYEVEHIMPASGQNIEQIRKDAGIEDVENFKYVVNKLGNKIILEESINRSLGNAWFRTKIQNSVSDKKGYKNSSFALAQKIVEEFESDINPIWKVENINNKTEDVADRICSFIFD
ncbi:MAG: HNH endonuclease [Campylobacter sp.]|nr:HNH endonuclease [Campylobacter sp.]